jgi:hypothetical protein
MDYRQKLSWRASTAPHRHRRPGLASATSTFAWNSLIRCPWQRITQRDTLETADMSSTRKSIETTMLPTLPHSSQESSCQKLKSSILSSKTSKVSCINMKDTANESNQKTEVAKTNQFRTPKSPNEWRRWTEKYPEKRPEKIHNAFKNYSALDCLVWKWHSVFLDVAECIYDVSVKSSIANCFVYDGDPGSDGLFGATVECVAFCCWML